MQSLSHGVLIVAALFILGCTGETTQAKGEGQSGNQPPVVHSARIVPSPVDLAVPLTVQVDAEDPDRNAISLRLKWYVNEKLVSGDNLSELAPDRVKQGDRVAVEVTPFDGTIEGSPYRTPIVTIGNSPPIVTSVTLEPVPASPGDRVVARVEASDPDGEPVQLSFRWWKNQSLVKEGEDAQLDTSDFRMKDAIRVEVTPQDGGGKGRVASSATLILGNSPPKILSTPTQPTGREQFVYLVQAKDADGDPVTYVLETAPPGMTIDKATGTISWAIPADLSGTHHVRVVVEDGQGGSSFQEFDLTLAPRPTAS